MVWIANGESGSSVRTKLNTIPNDGTSFLGPQRIDFSVPSSTGRVTFNPPSTFSHLMIIGSGRSSTAGTGADAVGMTFNNDTGSNYDYQRFWGTNAGTNAQQQIGVSSIYCGDFPQASGAANYESDFHIIIPNYLGTGGYKKSKLHAGVINGAAISGNYTDMHASGTWRNTGAITRIDFVIAGNYVNTLITLYGLP